jgi:hypothetical protein
MTSSITQGSSGRFEEYITLRQEMLELLAFCRQILYWTVVFVAGAIAWHMSNYPSKLTVSPLVFTFFLGGGLLLAFGVYALSLDQMYRVGSFLAVFWESRDPARGLTWHRLNRRGQVGRGPVPDIGVAVMAMASLFVGTLPMLYYLFPPSSSASGMVDTRDIVTGLTVGAAEAGFFWWGLRWWLKRRRLESEQRWRVIKADASRQGNIHDYFEGQPIVKEEEGGQSDQRSSGIKLNEVAVATALAGVSALSYIAFLVLRVTFPEAFQFIFNVSPRLCPSGV